MASANVELLDATVRHQMQLVRFAGGQAEAAARLLGEAREELAALLRTELPGATAARASALLRAVEAQRRDVMARLGKAAESDLGALAEVEAEWEGAAIRGSAPFALDLASPPAARLKAIVSTPINGVPLSGWLKGLEDADVQRVQQQIRLGLIEGEAVDSIVRRIRGTKAAGFADGVLAVTTRNAQAIVRTAVSHVSTAARGEVWAANADIIDGLRWTATLDGRTSLVCASRDGEVYPVDSGPRPPAHHNCRSVMVAVIDGEAALGDRPSVTDTRTRRARETDFRAEARAKAGDAWGKMTAAERNAAVAGYRRSWAAEHVGQVPSKTTFDDWLRRQSREFQDDYLGPARAKLFRDGAGLGSFVDAKGGTVTLKELGARSAGDALAVTQPGVGLKAKALLQQGLSADETLAAIQREFPDAATTKASIASYKSELKKAGALDAAGPPVKQGGLTPAASAHALLGDFESSLQPGLREAVSGQWGQVVAKLDGAPGAYAHYKAGQGVLLSAEKLGSIGQAQAKQVLAHELGHVINVQHGAVPGVGGKQWAGVLKDVRAALPPDAAKLYSYYLSSPEELAAEVIAQAISPSPLTSQGLSAVKFREAMAGAIDEARAALAKHFGGAAAGPHITPAAAAGLTAGEHKTVGSLAKALLQQGLPDDQVLAGVKAQFPKASTTKASIASYKSALKKAGLLPPASGQVVAAEAAAEPALLASKAAAAVDAPVATAAHVYEAAKAYAAELFSQGHTASSTAAKIKETFPLFKGKALPVASWKTKWMKGSLKATVGGEAVTLGPKAKAAAAVKAPAAAPAAPGAKPKLLGKQLGAHSTAGLQKAEAALAQGATRDELQALLASHFGKDYSAAAGGDLIDLAEWNVGAKASSSKTAAAVAKQAAKSVKAKAAAAVRGPRDGWPPPPRFSDDERAFCIRKVTGASLNTRGLDGLNSCQSAGGREALTREEYASLRMYTGRHFYNINRGLRAGNYAGDAALQGYVDAATSGWRKLPKYSGEVTRGFFFENLEHIASNYRPGAIVEEAAFTSTGKGGGGWSGNIQMHIRSHTGVDVSRFSIHPTENEVLFMPGSRFRVIKLEKRPAPPGGMPGFDIYMEEVV